jgi:hypothetical protein
MAQLTANEPRAYEGGLFNDLPVLTNVAIYEGSAVGESSGYSRQLVAGDPFQGFSVRGVDNVGGASGAKLVKVQEEGDVELNVTGASAVTHYGSTVYASDGNTFTLASTSNTPIGKVKRWISGTRCVVAFQSVAKRSL